MSFAPASSFDNELFPNDRKFISPETYDAFFAVIERLEGTIESETRALSTDRHRDITAFTRQKRQGFLELNRIMKSMEKTIPSQDVLLRLTRFKKHLATNDSLLRVHLQATQDVTALIVRVMRESESDGTYSQAYGRQDYDDL